MILNEVIWIDMIVDFTRINMVDDFNRLDKSYQTRRFQHVAD